MRGLARAVVQKMLDRAPVLIGKIENVDEVAHAESVTCVIVCAQN
jgi:hypothetical protein